MAPASACVLLRHILAKGYQPQGLVPFLPGKGAPGSSRAFQPHTNATGKPWIMVSGDDSGLCLHVSYPVRAAIQISSPLRHLMPSLGGAAWGCSREQGGKFHSHPQKCSPPHLKRRTCTYTWKYQPAYSFSLYGAPPRLSGNG